MSKSSTPADAVLKVGDKIVVLVGGSVLRNRRRAIGVISRVSGKSAYYRINSALETRIPIGHPKATDAEISEIAAEEATREAEKARIRDLALAEASAKAETSASRRRYLLMEIAKVFGVDPASLSDQQLRNADDLLIPLLDRARSGLDD